MVQKLRGKLFYFGWFNHPWRLVAEEGEIDVWPAVDAFFSRIAGKRASHYEHQEGYGILTDQNSEYIFHYTPDGLVLLEKEKGIGGSNVHAYLDNTFLRLNGRTVEIEADESSLRVTADPSEKVFHVPLTHGNSGKVSDKIAQDICKMGQGDAACIFLTFSGERYFCEKFNDPLARASLDRLAQGTIQARRIGDCALLLK